MALLRELAMLFVVAGVAMSSAADDARGTPDAAIMGKLAELEAKLRDYESMLQSQQLALSGLHSNAGGGNAPHHSIAAVQHRRLNSHDVAMSLDHMWLILCGALVMLMQAGFAMVESGSCREKNVQNILLKNLMDVCMGTIGWWAFGYTFAYGGDADGDGLMDNKFIGFMHPFGHHFAVNDQSGSQVPAMASDSSTSHTHWFFQWAFCATAATIVSGGVAERVQFHSYAVYTFVMTSFIYPVMVAWTWGYGWIASEVNNVGYIDFAGSGIVHMVGGVGALVGALCAGPRKDRFETRNPDEFAGHSTPLIVLGTFILWFGWYGFNCGSTLAMHDADTAAKAGLVAMNTTLAAAAGGLGVFLLRLIEHQGRYDVGGLCNGILSGLVSITAGCSNVDVGSAVLIGFIGALLFAAVSLLLKKLRIDDPVDAFAVHGACGAWGVLAAALFDWGDNSFANGWNGLSCVTDPTTGDCMSGAWSKQLAANLVEIAMVVVWSGGLSLLVFLPLRLTGLLRANDELQDAGLDAKHHSPPQAYSLKGSADAQEVEDLDGMGPRSQRHSPVKAYVSTEGAAQVDI